MMNRNGRKRAATAERLANRSVESIAMALDYQKKITVEGYRNERRAGSGGVCTHLFVARGALNHVTDVAVLKRSRTRQHVTHRRSHQKRIQVLGCPDLKTSSCFKIFRTASDSSSAAISLAIQPVNFLSSVVRQPSEERWEAEQHKAARSYQAMKDIRLGLLVDRSECSKQCQQRLVDVLR
ncbi:hypothetical protein T11_679 [Trichinella zimbabwensis]|uniref:Uncharacterized protein n=1 Tax=Trichinella zimbabwensis TaxID=268475 RepID=A0A0V1I1F3_9BILA|nr:hypothetical protein T11_679 [Trichinella zimbabwensis]